MKKAISLATADLTTKNTQLEAQVHELDTRLTITESSLVSLTNSSNIAMQEQKLKTRREAERLKRHFDALKRDFDASIDALTTLSESSTLV